MTDMPKLREFDDSCMSCLSNETRLAQLRHLKDDNARDISDALKCDSLYDMVKIFQEGVMRRIEKIDKELNGS